MDYHATYRSHWQHIRHWYQQKQRPIQILINAQSADAAAASHTFMKLLRSNCIKFDVHPILGCNLLSELGLVVSANATMVTEAEAMIMLDSDSSDDDGEGAGSVPPREAGDDEEVEAVHYEEEGGSYKFVTKKITKRQQRIQQWKEERRGRRGVSGEGGSRGNSNNNSRIETMWVLIGIGATVDINKIFNMKLDVYQEAITVSKSATSPAALATRPVCYVHIIDSTRPYHLSNIQHDAIPIGVGPSSVSHEWRFLQIWGGEQVRLEAGEFFKEKVGSGHWRRRESRYVSNGGLVKSGAGNVSEGGQSKRRRKSGKRARTSMEADERGDSVQGGIDNNNNDSNSVTSQQGVPAEEDIDSSDISSNNSDHDDENNSKDDDGSSSSLSISSDEDLTDQTALLDQWHSKGDRHTTSRAKSSIPSSLFWLRDPAAAGVTNKYREQYYCVHASGPSAALIIHLLCSDVNGGVRGVSVGDALDSLWAAAIGITDLYMQNMLNEEAYLLHLADLRAEITDLMSSNGNNNINNNNNNNANNGDAQVVLNPYVREYQALPLLRHWTLWDSMWHNKDIAKLLELHSDSRGEAVLMGFLATEGISIDEAQQEWTSVTPEKRSHILTVLKEKLMSLVWLVRSLPSNRLSIKNHNSDGINNTNTNNTLLTTSTSIYSAPFLTSFEISTISRKMGFSAEITSFDVCRIFYGVIGRRVPDHIAASAVSVFMTGGTDTSQNNNNNNNKQFDEYQRETFWEARDVLLASSHDPIFTRAVADTRQLYNHISHAARSMLTLRSRSLWRSRTLWFQTSLSSGEATQGVGSSSIGGSGHYILDSFWIPVRLGALADHLLIALNIKIPNNNNNNNNKSLSDSAVRPLQPRPLVLHCPLPIPPLPPTQSSAHVPQRQDLHLILLSYNRYVIGSGGESPCTSVVPIVRTAVAAAEDSEHFPDHNIVFVSSGVTGHGRWWVIRGKDAARQFIEIMSL